MDVSNPSAPTLIDTYTDIGGGLEVAFAQNAVFVASRDQIHVLQTADSTIDTAVDVPLVVNLGGVNVHGQVAVTQLILVFVLMLFGTAVWQVKRPLFRNG